MACPGGCIGGGGQPKTHDPLAILKRMSAVYELDERSTVRKSHENPAVQQLYKVGGMLPDGLSPALFWGVWPVSRPPEAVS